MRIALIETRGEKLAVNKDQAGTFGSALEAGDSVFSKILNKQYCQQGKNENFFGRNKCFYSAATNKM